MALLTLYIAVSSHWVGAWLLTGATTLQPPTPKPPTPKPSAFPHKPPAPLFLDPLQPSTPRSPPRTPPRPPPSNRSAPNAPSSPVPLPVPASLPASSPCPSLSDDSSVEGLPPGSSLLDPCRRDFSLLGAGVEMSDFRVVDNEYASHRVDIHCNGQEWAVWKRCARWHYSR